MRIRSSFLRFAAIQTLEHVNDPTGLTAQHDFIAAQAIQREIWQVRKAQEAPRKVCGGSVGMSAFGIDPLLAHGGRRCSVKV
jgi:hypothetical protein